VKNMVDAGHTAIMIMHSYSGQVGSNTMYGLGVEGHAQGGVAHLIYMCAFALPEGGSITCLPNQPC
jgi:hypothetical protein